MIDSTFEQDGSAGGNALTKILGFDQKRNSKKTTVSNAVGIELTEEEKNLPLDLLVERLTQKMAESAAELRYEEAAKYRDLIRTLQKAGDGI